MSEAAVQTSGLTEGAILAAAKGEWPASAHPLLPWFTDGELVRVLQQPGGAERVDALYKERERRIALAGDGEGSDPFRYGFELPCWKDADGMAREFKFLYVAGGKRAGKSERAAKRFVQAALKYPRGVLWAFQGNLTTSIATQQTLVWKYLPPEVRALNGKRDARKVYNVNYSIKNGFADRVLVLPNRTVIWFMTYEMEVKDYQGWQIGSPWRPGMGLTDRERLMQGLALNHLPPAEGEAIENIGFWADENMPFPWLETCELRCATNNARGLWTFSTTEGITPAIKQVLGTGVTLESRRAELLADRQNLPGVPRGEMPYRLKAERKDWGAIFFFSEFNPFGSNYANVRAFCEGKTSDVIMENAYGYARDTRHRAFPLFGEWNIIERKHLPKVMTRYMFTDPGDASRNWATIWVGVDGRGNHYIYRDWPDEQSYGEWAVPSEDPKQPDGKRGPAQRSLGYGTSQLAATWKLLEGDEVIFERFIDPRAANNAHIEEHGGTNLYQQFAALEEPPAGPGAMVFRPWSGVELAIGYAHVNELLYWNRDEALSPVNCPKLYVCADCLQVRWMFANFTGMGGGNAGGKDFADLVRGMALADLQFYESNEFKSYSPNRGY